MGLFDKLKNVFFEEEEVEVDEKEEERERIPVAKKIDTAEVKKREEIKEKEKDNNKEDVSNKLEFGNKEEKDFKFPMGFDDKDFEVEKTIEIFAPVKEKEVEVEIEPEPEPVSFETEEVVSDEPPMEIQREEYQYKEVKYEPEPQRQVYREERKEEYHKLYEGKDKEDEKVGFTPSPIISPIYGILNKNYKKEQIVTRSEIRKAEMNQKKDELDLVREKAYGDLAGEISASIEDEVIDITEEKPKEKEDLLYDLNDNEPTVKTVTVGDAEEYFNDLGLEYNVDYKVEKEENEEKEEKTKQTRTEKLKIEDKDDDDRNLFDLIDSMYEDEEKEK